MNEDGRNLSEIHNENKKLYLKKVEEKEEQDRTVKDMKSSIMVGKCCEIRKIFKKKVGLSILRN